MSSAARSPCVLAVEQLVVAGEVRRGPLVVTSRASRPVNGAGPAARRGAQDRDGAAVVRAGGQGATDRELDARGPELAAEHQHVNHLSGGLRAPTRSAISCQSWSKQSGQRALLALLGQRQRSGERARLVPEQLEIVVQLRAIAEPARCSRGWRATSRPVMLKTISRAPIRAATRSPASATGTEYWF